MSKELYSFMLTTCISRLDIADNPAARAGKFGPDMEVYFDGIGRYLSFLYAVMTPGEGAVT